MKVKVWCFVSCNHKVMTAHVLVVFSFNLLTEIECDGWCMTFDFHPLPGADEVSEDIMVTGHHHTHTAILTTPILIVLVLLEPTQELPSEPCSGIFFCSLGDMLLLKGTKHACESCYYLSFDGWWLGFLSLLICCWIWNLFRLMIRSFPIKSDENDLIVSISLVNKHDTTCI
jgi:hypothetical protein